MTDTSTTPTTSTPTAPADPGDHDRFAHIVVPKAKAAEAYALGTEVTALCGKTWVPSRDPKRYPICPSCKEIAESAGAEIPDTP